MVFLCFALGDVLIKFILTCSDGLPCSHLFNDECYDLGLYLLHITSDCYALYHLHILLLIHITAQYTISPKPNPTTSGTLVEHSSNNTNWVHTTNLPCSKVTIPLMRINCTCVWSTLERIWGSCPGRWDGVGLECSTCYFLIFLTCFLKEKMH